MEKKEQISASKSVMLDIVIFFFIPERRLWRGEWNSGLCKIPFPASFPSEGRVFALSWPGLPLNWGSFNQNSLAASKRRRGRRTCGWFALGRTFLAPSLGGAAALLSGVTGRLAGFPSGRDVLLAVLLAIHPRWPGSLPCRQKFTSSPGLPTSCWCLSPCLGRIAQSSQSVETDTFAPFQV